MIYPVDLQIKNWIYLDGKMAQVWGITEDRLHLAAVGRIEGYRNDGHCQPIPLTPKILEKCGFEHKGSDLIPSTYWHERYGIMLWPEAEYFEFLYNYIAPKVRLQYLHQLQNLFFALTDSELIIKL